MQAHSGRRSVIIVEACVPAGLARVIESLPLDAHAAFADVFWQLVDLVTVLLPLGVGLAPQVFQPLCSSAFTGLGFVDDAEGPGIANDAPGHRHAAIDILVGTGVAFFRNGHDRNYIGSQA